MITALPVTTYCLYILHVIMNPEALSRFHSKDNDFELQEVVSFLGTHQFILYILGKIMNDLLLSTNQDTNIGELWVLCFKKYYFGYLSK